MKKKELIKALSKIEEGIADVRNLLMSEDNAPTTKSTSEEDTADTETNTVEGRFSKEDLDAMKYNDLKKLGKDLGVKCTGTREEITAKILAVPVDVSMEKPVEDEAETTEEESKIIPMKKKSAKKEDTAEDNESDIEEQYLQMAREALADNELEDIITVLADAGIKLTALQKKKEDIIMTKLAEAFQNGLIDVDDEDEEDTEVSESEDTNEEEEFSEDSYFEQYDPTGVNHPDVMTKKRAKAVKALVADIIEKFENEELTTEDIESELEDIVTDDDIDLLGEDYSEEDLVAFYIEMKKKFVDDDGTIVEPSDPYEIGGENFCCGHELVYDKKGKKFVCPICEEEYEAE